MANYNLTIAPHPTSDSPTVIIGFSNEMFSQAVYITVSSDPIDNVKFADEFYAAYLKAAGEAVKRHRSLSSGTFSNGKSK
jgi:hypothetical protein